MKETVREVLNSARADTLSIKRRLNDTRANLDSTFEAVDKLELRFQKIETELENYKSRLKREYVKEIDRLREENTKLNNILQRYLLGRGPEVEEEEEEEVSEDKIKAMKIASTVAITKKFLELITGDNESFINISHATLFPNIYEKLMDDDGERYFLEKVPEGFSDLVNDGRKFVRGIFEELKTNIDGDKIWNDYIGITDKWWKEEALPLLYCEKEGVYEFQEEPSPYKKIYAWATENNRRMDLFPEVFDVWQYYRKHRREVEEEIGIDEIDMECHSGS